MPGRHDENVYRYGFQGQEKDDEIKGGEGTSLNYEYRMYDPRVGRFFAIDPLAPKYPHNSPYAFSENRVIDAIELEGLESVPFQLIDDLLDQVEYAQKNNLIKKSDAFVVSRSTDLLKFVRGFAGVTTAEGIVRGIDNYVTAAKADFTLVLQGKMNYWDWKEKYADSEASYFLNLYETGKLAVEGDPEAIGAIAGMVATIAFTPTLENFTVKTGRMSKYSALQDSKSVGRGKKFTKAQKRNILEANREANGGVLKSDKSSKTLDQPTQSIRGQKANMNQAEIDHIVPKSKGGTNSYKNAQVLSKEENLLKSNKTP